MFRLVSIGSLVLLLIVTLLSSLSLIVGSALPDDLQFIWALPRQNRWQPVAENAPFPIRDALFTYLRPTGDQWTTVGLYSTERHLSAVRQLPIRTGWAQWDEDGESLVISGRRNDFERTYQMSFTSGDSRVDWLPTFAQQPFSPDGRWLIVYTFDANGAATGLKAVPAAQIDQHRPDPQVGDETKALQYLHWADDSASFTYAWHLNSGIYRPNELPQVETRRYHPGNGTEEIVDASDPGFSFNPAANVSTDMELRHVSKAQPFLPGSDADRYRNNYDTVLYNRSTGEETRISDQAVYNSSWSGDGRYLLFYEYTPSLAELAGRLLFRPPQMSGWSGWHMLYQPATGSLIPAQVAGQYGGYGGIYYGGYGGFGSAPYNAVYYSGYGRMMAGGGYYGGFGGMRYGGYGGGIYSMPSHRAYLFDTQTGQRQPLTSNALFGSQDAAQWLMNSDILLVYDTNGSRQYYSRPGEEPKLLHYNGENLVTFYKAVRTIGVSLPEITSLPSASGGISFSGPSFSGPGLPLTQSTAPPIPDHYYIDFEREVVAPLSLAPNEIVNYVDDSLQQYGIDVGVVLTHLQTPASFTSGTVPNMNVYLLTETGIVKVIDNLASAYAQSFGLSQDEFILILHSNYNQAAPVPQLSALHFTQRDGVWQQKQITGNFNGLMAWRPKGDRSQGE